MSTSPEQARAEVRSRRRATHLSTVCVNVEVDVDDVLREVPDEQLLSELHRRSAAPGANLLAIYEEFARRGDAPQCLKDYVWEHLGRIL